MFVGIDVHKHQHAAALVDDRGGEIATLIVANSPDGYRRLLGWLGEHGGERAVIGVESPGSYGRRLVGALAAAGHEVLHVPAWRTHRERHRQGPGKTDPGDAMAIADVVRRKRGELGPAMEPELVRALAILELQRRRFVRDRTQAIQRLRADWTQFDPVAEAGAIRCDRQRELRRLKRISFGDGLVEQLAARCLRELARDIEDLNRRSPPSMPTSPSCSPSTKTRSPTSTAPAPTSPQRSSPKPATSAASATPPPSRASAAPPRSPAAQDKPPAATDSTAAATDNSTPRSTASRSSNNATTRPPRPTSPANSPKARPPARPDERSNATSPTSSTAASTAGPTTPQP
jgi:Transposase